MANGNTLSDRIEQVQLPGVPTSQSLAQGLGATPQQVAMTGTQAQVQATIADRIAQAPLVESRPSQVAQRQELSRVQRLTPEAREPTVQEALEAERADKLAKLGHIGQSIQSRIQQELSQAAQQQVGQVSVQEPLLAQTLGLAGAQVELAKADPTSNYNKVRSSLEQYLGSGDPNDLEAAAATIDNLKILGLSSSDARRLVGLTQATMAKQTGQTVAENVMDQVTVGELDLQQLGFEQGTEGVAELLGVTPEELSQFSIDELADAVQDQQQEEFSRVAALKAELQAAPLGSIQREVLLRELRDLGEVGITGVEAEVTETVEDIDLAGVVKVGDETMKVSEFLDDERLSQMVTDWINEDDPTRKEELIPEAQFPELVSWIRSNQLALAQLSETAGDTLEQFNQANDDYKSLNVLQDVNLDMSSDLMSAMLPDWDPNTSVTSQQLQEAKANLNSSLVGQLSGSQKVDSREKKDILSKMNSLSPESIDSIKNMSVDDVRIAHSAAEVLSETPELAEFLDIKADQGFVLDEQQQDQINEYADAIEQISNDHAEWLRPGKVLDTMKGLSPEELKALSNDERIYRDLENYVDLRDRLGTVGTVEDKVNLTLGQSMSLEQLNEEYQDAQKWANLGDKEARAKATFYGNLFGKFLSYTPTPGSPLDSITEQDLDGILDGMNDKLSISPSDVVSGNLDMEGLSEASRKFSSRPLRSGPSDPILTKYGQFVQDGSVTIEDISQIDPNVPVSASRDELGKWLDSNPNITVDIDGFDSYASWDQAQVEDRSLEHIEMAMLKDTDFLDVDALNDFTQITARDIDIDSDNQRAQAANRYNTMVNLPGKLRERASLMDSVDPKQSKLLSDIAEDIEGSLVSVRNALLEATRDSQDLRQAMGIDFYPGASHAARWLGI